MRITSTSRIAGYPAVVIRDLLRGLKEGLWGQNDVAVRLGVSREVAERVIARLATGGYVRRDRTFTEGGPWYSRTTKGNRLALASAAPPLKRRTAERQLQAFLDRVKIVNGDPYYLYRVSWVVLFGSMLTTAPRVSDVDVAIEMRPKLDHARQRPAEDERILHARLVEGRRFRNLAEEVWWPKQEVRLFLKSRSRAISIHEADRVVERTATRVLFEDPRPLKRRSGGGRGG